ncbi:MAG: polysaccharide deacetylase family protein [Longimicrobiales bacterium]
MKRILVTLGALVILAGCGDSPAAPSALPGMMTITFDDGWSSAYTRGLPTLRAHGLRGNIAVVTDYVDLGFEGFMNLPQLQAVHQAGWSIVSHTVGHPNLTLITASELERELTASKSWIESKGFNGSSVFVVPYHAFGDRELAAIRQHYSAARIANASFYVPSRFEEWPPDDPHGLTAIEAEFAPFTTEAGRAALEQQIATALTDGKFVDVLFHDIEAEDFAAFQQTVAMLAQFEHRIRPYHELFP